MMFIGQKVVEILIQGKKLRILFSLLCLKYIFSWFYRSVGFEGNIKSVLCQLWNALKLQLSLPLGDK